MPAQPGAADQLRVGALDDGELAPVRGAGQPAGPHQLVAQDGAIREAHDPRAFESFLHAGTVFNVGTADADKGRDNVVKSWAEIVDGKGVALRWRPGIVHIGGESGVAVSRGTFILQRTKVGAPVFSVGMFQSVWVRDARDGVRRVLFDGSATTSQPMDDRAAADRWVEDQAMSDCAS